MKKYLLLSIFALILIGCSGGSSVSSSLGTNDVLGDLPKIYDNYELNHERLKTEYKESSNTTRKVEISKEVDELKAQIKVDTDATGPTLNGKDVPFTYSKALEASPEMVYSIQGPIKIEFSPTSYIKLMAQASIVTKAPMKLSTTDRMVYVGYVKMVNSNNEAISVALTHPLSSLNAGEYPAGTNLGTWDIGFQYTSNAQMWGDFKELIFCTEEEYNIAEADISKRFDENQH